jgi:hypothetical protein
VTVHTVTTVQGLVPGDVMVRLLSPGTLVVDLGDRRSSARVQVIDEPHNVIGVVSAALLAALRLAPDSESTSEDLVGLCHLVLHGHEPADTEAMADKAQGDDR